MITFTLNRQNHMTPDFNMLNAMRNGLEQLIASDLNSADFNWKDVVNTIVPFQYEDGSFNLLDSYRIESDCRVYYCHEATYICTALLMKALLTDAHILAGKEGEILPAAMHMCCARHLNGHGFDSLKGQINALNYFIKCDVKIFLDRYPQLCPEFNEMIQNIEQQFAIRVSTGAFYGDWGEDYEDSIREIHEYFDGNYVFVYGTLMKGQSNHEAFLRNARLVGNGILDGYDMYDLGHYPGIVKAKRKGKVEGEIYRVTDAELMAIDELEGEGYLYLKTPVNVTMDGNAYMKAFAYVYNKSVKECQKLGSRYGR